ncbi:MAG: D-aminoacyl-tRNA deacylase [Candidatus Hermodarchaeota archaeon]
MNLRDKLLNSNIYDFKETEASWHGNSVFELMNFPSDANKLNKFSKLEIFLGLTKEPLIFLNDLKLNQTNLNPDFLIFASRHTSKAARPAFLVHTTGNWGKSADFGGEPQDLSLASALLHKAGFISLIDKEFSPDLSEFSVDIEVTHHGPTVLKTPLIFMELGSSKTEWVISEAGESVATAIISTIFKFLDFRNSKNQEIGLGFGGTHYAPNFRRLIENTNIAMSFICPKYYINELNVEMIYKMVNNTIEPIDYFIIDWKGTNSEDKKHLIPLLEEFEIPIKKTKDF